MGVRCVGALIFLLRYTDTGASIELEYPHMTILALYIETT